MKSNIISNYISRQYPLGSEVLAQHASSQEMRNATVCLYVVTGPRQNIPIGVIVEFKDNSRSRFEQGEIDHEVNIKPVEQKRY